MGSTINLNHSKLKDAKCNNRDLVVFVNNHGVWSEVKSLDPCFYSDRLYFVCIPRHKVFCFHWLNGQRMYCATNNQKLQPYENFHGNGLGSYWTKEVDIDYL